MLEITYQWPFPEMDGHDAADFCRDCPEDLIEWLPWDVLSNYLRDREEDFRTFMRVRAEHGEVAESWLD